MKSEIIPVIHMIDESQVLQNVKTCIECGVGKIFLINHFVSSNKLIDCSLQVKKNYPNLWVGINMLDKTTEESLSYEIELDGIWCDTTISIEEAKKHRKFNGLFFGSLAFKYQKQPTDLKAACEEARLATDIATTSGEGTGKAANVNKIKSIYSLLNGHPMAIASGVSPENIQNYNKMAKYLLVASSITDETEIIIKNKLLKLTEKNKQLPS